MRSERPRGSRVGSSGGASRSSRASLDQTAALFAPIALIVGLALAGGGFAVTDRHIAGLAVWLVVIALLVFGAGSGARLGWPLYAVAGLLGGFALFSALSSLWSGSTELSVIEADRDLVYLGFFLAAFLIAQTDERRQRFAEGLVIAVTLICLSGAGQPSPAPCDERLRRPGHRAAPALPARLLERQRRGRRDRRRDAALDQPRARSGRVCDGSRQRRSRRSSSPSTSPTPAAGCSRSRSPPAA